MEAAQREFDRSLRWARDQLRTGRFDDAHRYVATAEAQLDALPPDRRAVGAAEVAEVRASVHEAMRAWRGGRLMSTIGRVFGSGQTAVDRSAPGNMIAELEACFARIDEYLGGEDGHWLDDAQRDEIRARKDEMAASVAAQMAGVYLDRADKAVVHVERIASGDLQLRFIQEEDGAFERGWASLADCVDASDPRVVDLRARLETAQASVLAARAATNSAATIARVVDGWRSLWASYGSAADGWQHEHGHGYEDWRGTRSLNLPRTAAALDVVARFRSASDIREAIAACGQEPTVAGTLSQVHEIQHAAIAKIAGVVTAILDAAGLDAERHPFGLADTLAVLSAELRRYPDDCDQLAAVLPRIESVAARAREYADERERRAQEEQAERDAAAAAQVNVTNREERGMTYEEICDGWNNATAMASLNGKLYILDNGSVYRVQGDGSYDEVSDGWGDATLMTAMNGHLWIIHNGSLYRLSE